MIALVLDRKLPLGTAVHSKLVGTKAEFDGIIRGYSPDGAYHVIDAAGKLWHRESREIAVINPSEASLTPP
ncbi:hypothetical protein NL154_05570 [Rhizobium sp. YTUHZ044]|uniref:hypothetical protein n=1 Tax=Rhizobium sp. YTUHZ044 TaxID=2962678 RepID=UPI003DA9AE78